jgi:hypothetical protein
VDPTYSLAALRAAGRKACKREYVGAAALCVIRLRRAAFS